ncbi:MAG: acyl-CoA/acyl-ACP dehydrogenase [Rhodocyclaceae bacterium]|jgi:acyl-CoA dehydrogenase|nr:acyl-CoA/acyl-ACP dehydrogenase [Rhodocyclaceae bacterium]MBK6552793.1 acyl-CoA/acyl-ACP dehydrogenase [Rhodocyclaceae bacterium]MBK9312324.1 acyl-CoA/acyl-ACP dehydrogenase [Rhodocyclaceae bacterium]
MENSDFDLDIDLTEEMLAARTSCRRFAREVMRPVGQQLDRLTAEQVIAADSPLWTVLKRYTELGFGGGADIGAADLSPAQSALLHAIVVEELAWGDSGIFITCGLNNIMPQIARGFGRPDLAEFFAQRDEIACLAVTEPGHGSDHIAFTEPGYRDPRIKPALKVRRQGDDFLLNGQKAAWVSCGTIAGSCILFGSFEDSPIGLADGAAFLIPLDLPGITRGKPLEKLGQRTLNQGEIFFSDVRVPRRFLLAEGAETYPLIWEAMIRDANLHMGPQFVGVARAAYDCALDYAKQWVQGGVPIIQHQAVKVRLFDMFRKVEAARSHARRVAVANAVKPGGVPFQHAVSVKVLCTQTAFEVASDALQLFGGNGLTKEYPIEKLFRDARASLIEDGENGMLGIMAASRL